MPDAAPTTPPPRVDEHTATTRVALAAAPVVAAALLVVATAPGRLITAVVLAAGAAGTLAAVVALVARPAAVAAGHARLRADQMESALVAERRAHDVQDRLDAALPVCDSEADALRAGLRAVGELLEDRDVALLLPVPDEPRVSWRLPLVDGELAAARPVAGTPACAAMAARSTRSAARSTALDACAHLRGDDLDGSSVCVPMIAADQVIGVLSVIGPPGELPDDATIRRLEWTAARLGARVGALRAETGGTGRSRPDPLTGLPTRAALREHLRQLVRSLSPFCVAVLRIDGWGDLPTDDAADMALCTVADVVDTTLRPGDLVFRMDGAQFAAVLVGCTTEQATGALERAREALVLSLALDGIGPPVTFSAGVVSSERATSLEHVVELAEVACDEASLAGGNRVSVAG